ncbi:ABC transporter substrate-binding protein [Skermanella aerolata]|uniref:ABC transporter substrate-binding protein n=1 Tax=Skermanella aerolata TaxID=393310 RepID=A0A512E200_9PROT|nr:acyclic terpene utilization AtuA family protein [Skermanella aerolata]KJB90908.1 ABC transporter substrate-binding protein [Skermanella aerolata KACC 11604]GEO42742.1 ABC transporter substrate-binding protein [Skermanella aerolata]
MVRIGCGAGFGGDRLEPAVRLLEDGALDYLVLECLAERTIGLGQKRRLHDPASGYDPLLERRMRPLLPLLKEKGTRIVTNMGSANPLAAGRKIARLAGELGIDITVAVVTGDDVLSVLDPEAPSMEDGRPLSSYGRILSANAYLGADAILPALQSGADVVITGRVADPSLVVAPLAHHFGWDLGDADRIGQGTVVGHLLECAGQITGGYFADPGRKDVPGLADLGFPFADVDADGNCVLSKVAGTGGLITAATVKEQLLYEVTDPTGYVTPDVIADFRSVRIAPLSPDRVEVSGGTGRIWPDTLKVSVGYHAGYVGEGEISYAGANALTRARLAGEALHARLASQFPELRVECLGGDSFRYGFLEGQEPTREYRLRIVGRAQSRETAEEIGREVEALLTNGPAGGGGARKYVQETVGIVSALLSRTKIEAQLTVMRSAS